MRIVRRPLFLDDLADSYAYLAQMPPRGADLFLEHVAAVVDLIAAFPEIGRPREDVRTGLRSFRVRRFRHLIFYRIADDHIVLLRILHGARNLADQDFG